MSGFPVAAPSVLPSATFAGRDIPLYGSAAQGVNGWANFPATANVNLAGFDIANANEIVGDTKVVLTVAGGASVGVQARVGVSELGAGFIRAVSGSGISVDPDTGGTVLNTDDQPIAPGMVNSGAKITINSASQNGSLVLQSGASNNNSFPSTTISLISPAAALIDDPGYAFVDAVGGIKLTAKDAGAVNGTILSLKPNGEIQLKNEALPTAGLELLPSGQVAIGAPGSTVQEPEAIVSILNAGYIAFDPGYDGTIDSVNNINFVADAAAAREINRVKKINGFLYPPPGITTITEELIIAVPGGAAQVDVDLDPTCDGRYFVVDTSATGSSSYTINFRGAISVVGGTFFIKNISTTDAIEVSYNGVPADGINSLLFPRVATYFTNSALCVCYIDPAGVMTVY